MNTKKIESLILKSFISTAVAFSVAVAVPNFVVNKNCNLSLITASKVYAATNISQDNMKTISAGNSSFVVKADGTLWACGLNDYGQLGDGTTTNKPLWEQVGSDFSEVVSSGGHSLALKTDGTLWACGYNLYGQLGDGSTTNKQVWEQVGAGFSQISCGEYHSLALKTDGTLYSCGYNEYGQLGDNSTSDKSSWELVGTDFSQIACGAYSSMALKSYGTLLACGYNSYGNLGDGTVGNKLSWDKVGADFSKVASGDYNSLALKTDGTLYGCGLNDFGELGNGTTNTTPMFKEILTGVANNSEDKTAPQIILSQDTDGWTNNKVTISVSVSDDGTGVDKIQTPDGNWVSSDSTTYNVTANGTYTFKAADKAGNEASKSITINNIDTTAPGAPGINLDKNKLTITGGSDSESGVKETDYQLNNGAWIKYTDTVTLDDGNYTINVRTIDNAGNSSVIVTTEANVQDNQTVTLIITFVDDTSKTYEISQDEFNDFIGWYTAEVDGESDQSEYTFKGQDTEHSKPIAFNRITSIGVE